MTISENVRNTIITENKYKKEVEFLKSLGEYRIFSSYYARQIEFERNISEEEVKKFFELFPSADFGGDFSYAKDFVYNTNDKDIDINLSNWLDKNAYLSANGGADGNSFSDWTKK